MADEWEDFVGDLLAPPETERDTSWDDLTEELLGANSSQQPESLESGHVEPRLLQSNTPNWSVSMFGKLDDLVRIGNDTQKQLFSAFQSLFPKPGKKPSTDKKSEDRISKIFTSVVQNKRLISTAALAEHAEVPPTTAQLLVIQLACALVYSATFLIGCFFSAICKLVQSHHRYKAIAVVNVFKYDETPLRLSVQEFSAFVGKEAPEFLQRKRNVFRKGRVQTETYCHTKVLAIDWRYGTLTWFGILNFSMFSDKLFYFQCWTDWYKFCELNCTSHLFRKPQVSTIFPRLHLDIWPIFISFQPSIGNARMPVGPSRIFIYIYTWFGYLEIVLVLDSCYTFMAAAMCLFLDAWMYVVKSTDHLRFLGLWLMEENLPNCTSSNAKYIVPFGHNHGRDSILCIATYRG